MLPPLLRPPPPNSLDLSSLSNLKITNSTASSDLLNETYWGAVVDSFDSTVSQMMPNTVMGYMNTSAGWKQWALQTVPAPPAWLSSGLESYLEAQLPPLKARVLSMHNATLAALIIQDLAGSIAGYGLGALDFVTFNGVTALWTYLRTGSGATAICATVPAQLGTLFREAFDSKVPQKVRAQYLGNALAVSLVMVVLAGADGFSPKFKVALERVGLSDSWGMIKSLLGKLPSKTAYVTFSILQRIAARFPSDASWATGFAADRIESMVEVLKQQKSFSDDAIAGEIGKLANVADSSGNPDDVPFAADVSSYNHGGGIRVKIGSQNQVYLYSDSHGEQYIKASFLEKEVSGFVKGKTGPLKVTLLDNGATLYLRYRGGQTWAPTVSQDVAGPNDVFTISFDVLTRDDFVSNLHEISLGNSVGARWVSDTTEQRLLGSRKRIGHGCWSIPCSRGCLELPVEWPVSSSFGFYDQWATLDFQIKDMFGDTRGMRIYHDGHHPPWLGIVGGDEYRSVYTLSYDGARLRAVYSQSREFNVASIYLSDPSVFYRLGEEGPSFLSPTPAVTKIYEITSVDFQRDLEKNMIFDKTATAYDHGRVGAEIAYTVGRVKYGLQDLTIREPSVGGADLFTQDKTAVMQARFIKDFSQFKGMSWEEALQSQMGKLVSKLDEDFANNHSFTMGYAVLSYVDPNLPSVIRTIVAEVPAPVWGP